MEVFCKMLKKTYTVKTQTMNDKNMVKKRDESNKPAPHRVYFDVAATTPLDERVFDAILPLLRQDFGNAGSIHTEGVVAKKLLSDARATCARTLHAGPEEIIFTSGGTESNNLAIFGTVIHALEEYKGDYTKIHIVTSVIEHASVLEVCRELERRGAHVAYVPVDEQGFVVMDQMKKAITPETTLVTVMMANNEIGTIQSIAEIARHIRKVRKEHKGSQYPYFHTDAAQVPVWQAVYVEKLGVDLVSIDGHKIAGPKGIGLLYIRNGVHVAPLFFGGGQEGGMRPGTEPLPLIVGLAKALEICEDERDAAFERMSALQDHFVACIRKEVPQAEINGESGALPNIVNISIHGYDSDFLVISLDERGVSSASKSACHASDDSSHVIAALGKGEEAARSTLRFSMPKETTKEDIDRVIAALVEIIAPPKSN